MVLENQNKKGRVLLIYPPSPVINREDRCQQPTKELLVIPPLPPTDLMYLASIVENCGFEAIIRDYSQGGNFEADLKEIQPNYLIANIATPTFKSDMMAVQLAKEIVPSIIINIIKTVFKVLFIFESSAFTRFSLFNLTLPNNGGYFMLEINISLNF